MSGIEVHHEGMSWVKEEVTHYGAKKWILKNKKTGKITEKVEG